MEQLHNFITEHGGSAKKLLDGFTCRVTKKGSGTFNVSFYNAQGRRFRSMLQVGRHFGLIDDGDAKGGGNGSNKHSIRRRAASKEVEAEKKKLRKELDRLRKSQRTATKALDAYAAPGGEEDGDDDKNEDCEPVDDYLLLDDNVTRLNSAAARLPDIDGFPGVPQHCVPDVLMAWDFLCTFSRALSLTPIALDDFAAALVYTPPEGQIGDDVAAPPVFLAEAHLGLLKILLQDEYSDDWWWSTLETVEEELPDFLIDHEQRGKPVIKVDVEALLSETEDPLITASWLKSLETVGKVVTQPHEVKLAIKTALKLVANKWVHAYLRKTLDAFKSSDPKFMTQSILFLVKCVREARPDLVDRTARSEKLRNAKEKVIAEAKEQIEGLSASAPVVTSDEALSDVEYDSDDSDDEEGESQPVKQDATHHDGDTEDESKIIASVIPPRPTPSVVDLLLPPSKPSPNSEYVNAFTWSAIVGATSHRVLHRKKRLLNEVDDYLRSKREMKPPTVAERREREKHAASRVLTECEEPIDNVSPTEKAIEHLCNGGNYLQLSTVERLCVLRLMIEASYDTSRLYEVVNGNIKQRQSAMKALEMEQRRARKEEKEKMVADVAAARERLAMEVKEKFVDERREEIRKLNEKSKEFSDDMIESLTEEDIVDFDEDIKADFLALPTADSFNKTDVKNMVAKMQEEAAFDCDALRVMTLDELVERENLQLEEMEGQLLGFGGENALADPNLDRETVRSIERLQKDITKARESAEKLPLLREKAMEQLKDAMEDGTIKVLRTAITAAKKAKLSGPDEETGGVWAVDLMRDAALELDRAKTNKRVLDAQRDLVTKRNKCFIRTEPMGTDRFANRFWTFDNDEDGHFWVDTEYCIVHPNERTKPHPGFMDIQREEPQIAFGAKDYEEDFMGSEELTKADAFRLFSRREHHSDGFTPTLVKNNWGCQATEESLRAVIKVLNGKGVKEGALKTRLKESLEHTVGNDEKQESSDAVTTVDDMAMENGEQVTGQSEIEVCAEQGSGDSQVFTTARDAAIELAKTSSKGAENLNLGVLERLQSGIGQRVRVRQELVGGTKDQVVARYENGSVVGWKYIQEEVDEPRSSDEDDDEEMMDEPKTASADVPFWKVSTDRGHTFWLKGDILLASICRYEKSLQGRGYFEDDAAFFAYRNHLGRYLGRAQEAPYSCSPNYFASVMVKREGELYSKLKIRSYDNNWGGMSGARALWTNSMKDYAFDFQTVKQGLMTLEGAFFELTGEFTEYENIPEEEPDAKALLDDPATRIDIELETIEKNVPGLWNSKATRLVFREIVSSSRTTGVLALCLDLLCRNTMKYLQKHKLLSSKRDETDDLGEYAYLDEPMASRRTRGMNQWQRQKKVINYEEFF